MKKLFLLFGLSLIWSYALKAQNLVPNPSFEDTVACPSHLDNMQDVKNWWSARGTPDYYNNCSPNMGFNNPVDYQQANSGEAYIGIATGGYTGSPINYREFVSTKLKYALIPGQEYFVSFFICFPNDDNLSVASNKLGVNFSVDSFSKVKPFSLINSAKVYTNSIYTDTVNWYQVKGSFIADSAYRYLVIGNFFEDGLYDTLNLGKYNKYSYYFIDDVCISKSKDCYREDTIPNFIQRPLVNKPRIFPNPSTGLINIDTGQEKIQKVKIYNLSGILVFSKDVLSADEVHIEPDLHSGHYILQIQTSKNTSFHKIIFFNY